MASSSSRQVVNSAPGNALAASATQYPFQESGWQYSICHCV